jgi:folate-dependent phosphoribosylglycinamide formyltransferase PurN
MKDLYRVAWLFSGGASSMQAAVNSPKHNSKYQTVVAVSNYPSKGRAEAGWDFAAKNNITTLYQDPGAFQNRKAFYEDLIRRLGDFRPDIICLSGYTGDKCIICEPFFGAFKNMMLNVHPADTSIIAPLNGRKLVDIGNYELKKIMERHTESDYHDPMDKVFNQGWDRAFMGDDAVFTAIMHGEIEVCSSIHSVIERTDAGANLVQSKRKQVDRDKIDKWLATTWSSYKLVGEYAHGLQDEMKTDCDGPAFCQALEFLADDRMKIFDDHVDMDGNPLPYGGHQMGSDVVDD